MRPSEQFMELMVEYYLKQGFEYKKNQKKFVRKDKGIEQVVFISFLKSGTLVEAQLQWGINLLDFERVFAQLKGWSKKMDTGYTFGTELNQLPEARNAGRFYEFKLYNERSLEYDNPSLLKAAAAFATAYERYAIPFFHRYTSPALLDADINRLPIECPYMFAWRDKHVALGVMLAAIYHKENFDSVVSSYEEYISALIPSSKAELTQILEKTLDHIASTEVERLLRITDFS